MVEAMEIQKGFKKTEVGVIPNDWKLLPVSKFGEVKRGAGSQYIKYVNYNGIRFIRINDFFEDSPVYVSPTVDMMRFAITESDVLFAGTGASAGASYIPKKEWIGLPHSYNAPRIRTNENHSKEFLLHTLQSEYIAKQQRAWFVGAAQPFLDLNAISNFLIATPPTKAEQAAIAEALNDADALITELEKLIAKKKAIKQGAMQELLKPKEGWEVEKLPELVWYQEGPGVRKSQFRTSGVKLLNGTNIERGELLLDKTDRFISNHEAYGWYSHFLVDDGDILIACSGISVDKFDEKVTEASSIHLPLCMNTSTMRFKVISTRITKPFFFHFLKSYSFKQQIGEQITGSAQLNFGPAHVKWVDINFPSPSEQNEIAQILSDMDAETEVLEKKLNKYKMLKQGMMQNLLTGRIRLV